MFTEKPRTLRIMAWIFFAFAGLVIFSVFCSFFYEPDWNRAGRLAEAGPYLLIAFLLRDLANCREKVETVELSIKTTGVYFAHFRNAKNGIAICQGPDEPDFVEADLLPQPMIGTCPACKERLDKWAKEMDQATRNNWWRRAMRGRE